jgi:hypothetical protein
MPLFSAWSLTPIDFHDTSFFPSRASSFPRLPTPAAILQQYPGLVGGVVKYEHLNLAVNLGHSSLRLEEAQTMIALRQAFPNNEVPIPEFWVEKIRT